MVANIYAYTLRNANLIVGVFVDDIEGALNWIRYDERTKDYLIGKIENQSDGLV